MRPESIGRIILLAILLSVGFQFTYGQKTKILGIVLNAETKEPIPFANVFFPDKTIGATSSFDGSFSLETTDAGDSLFASFIGYRTKAIKISKGIFQEITFELKPENVLLDEVIIFPGENPAEVLLRKIIANKEKNDKKEFDAYQYEVYTKIQFDANNINDKLKERRLLRAFKFIFDYVDTSVVNGKAFLPVFLTETLSDFYYRSDPPGKVEVIKASKVSGLENESVTQFLGDLYQKVNIYDNYISIFDKNFVSPIANFGLGFYKYYLIDSAFIDNQWCYHLMFKPRRKQELTFLGEMWIHDTTYALKSVEMTIAEDANLNFVNTLGVKQDYKLVEDQYWMLKRDYLVVDFNVVENSKRTVGFFGHRTTMYKDFILNQPKEKSFYNVPADVIIDDSARDKTDNYWSVARHEGLTEREEGIYEMIDSVKSVPLFRSYFDFFYMLINGNLKWGNIEIGPYYKLVSYNDVEGLRLRFGGETSNKFSTRLLLTGHVAYGFKDEKFKYNLGFLYLVSKNPRRGFGAEYTYDMEQLGSSINAFSEDNLFSSFFRRNPATKLSMVQEFDAHYEHEWFPGFSNRLNLIHRTVFPVGDNRFLINNGDGQVIENSLTTSEIQFNTRFAYKEKFIMGEFERISLGTNYPVFDVTYGLGIPDLLNGEYHFHRLQFGIRHWFNVFSFGWSKYILETGKIWGTLPYPLLKIMPGNETFLFDEYAYNLMDYYEYLSDAYLSLYYTHHFDGLFLDRLPLMRKLKWRTVAHARGVIGTLTSANKNYSEFPAIMGDLQRPYYEAGVGIENIFRIFRVDAIWRLTHRQESNVDNFALFLSFWFSF